MVKRQVQLRLKEINMSFQAGFITLEVSKLLLGFALIPFFQKQKEVFLPKGTLLPLPLQYLSD